MFFVCVVCSCTNGIEITCAACKPLCHTPTTSYLITQSLVWIRWHMYRTFLNPVSNCALDISLPFENVSYEFFAVQLLREETGIHFFASSISNSRLSNIPPPPDSTVNWDSRSNRIWPSPCQSASHYYEKGKVSQSTSPNFVPCSTPGGSRHITQGTRTRSTNPFHRTTSCRRRRET